MNQIDLRSRKGSLAHFGFKKYLALPKRDETQQ